MTGIAPDRPLSAGLQGGRGRGSFPERPVLTAPPNLQPPRVADARRQRLAAQPWLGAGGLSLTAVVFFALALGTGSTVVAAIAVVLTIAGQAVIERPDIGAVFEATPGPAAPTTFPATMALAGIAALVLSWAIGVGAYFLFVNISYLPAAERAAAGLRNPGGPVTRADFGAALIAVGVWQAVLFIALRGWPVNAITRRSMRLLAGNALVIGLGAGSYAVLRDAAVLSPTTIGAVCGCVITAVLVVAMLFEGWPAALLRPAASRVLTLTLAALVAVVLYGALAAYADGVHWIRATPGDWSTSASLSFAGAGIILHVGIGLRWPFALKTDRSSQIP